MRHHKLIILLLTLASCSGQDFPPKEDSLVVEAWICSGQAPEVMLSTSIVAEGTIQDPAIIDEHTITDAEVTISDGEKEVVLAGERREGVVPPFVYTTDEIKGEVGKTYSLTIKTPRYKASASERIPAPVELDEIIPEHYGDNDTSWVLRVRFRDNPAEHNYYKCFSKIVDVDSTFYPTRLGFIDDALLSEGKTAELVILPGGSIFTFKESRPCYYSSDKVLLKFCTLDEGMARVWRTYDATAIMGALPILSTATDVPGNVNGALGYFAAYGCSEYTVTFPK